MNKYKETYEYVRSKYTITKVNEINKPDGSCYHLSVVDFQNINSKVKQSVGSSSRILC